MRVLNQRCVNSRWIARFYALPHEEACECFGECKVRVEDNRGYVYVLTEREMMALEEHEATHHRREV